MANFRKVTKGVKMEQSRGRPATQIEVEAFNAISKLQDENRELRLTIRQLRDEIERLQAENKRLSERVNDLEMEINDFEEREW